MLSYSFQVLREKGYCNCATETFVNTPDLLSAILVKGISTQIKRGLFRDYIGKVEPLTCPRGKILLADSIKDQTILKQQLVCNYDEFSTNVYLNRILKTVMLLLLPCKEISKARKHELKNLLLYFKDVETLSIHGIDWNQRLHRNNQAYQMLINVCYLIVEGLLQTDSQGNMKLQRFLDEQRMCRLYEKFILEYYRKEFPQMKAAPSQIKWQVDDDTMLPAMKSDIMLTYHGDTLIIDAKYYSHTTQIQYDMHKLHSANLYQIFTYVKNEALASSGTVSGMLLYARTDEAVQPDQAFQMSGNQISVKTLDLDCDFSYIAKQLNEIAFEHFDGLGVAE